VQLPNPAPNSDGFVRLTRWLGDPDRSRGWRGYLYAGLAVGATAAVRVMLEVLFHDAAPTYLLFLMPILASGLIGGFGPALLATVLGLGVSHYFFIEPAFNLKGDTDDWVIAGVFALEGLAVGFIADRLRVAVRQLMSRESQLVASEASLVMAQSAARIATYNWDPQTGAAEWSDNAEAIMGMEPGTFDGTFEDSLRTVLPEDRPLIIEASERLLREGRNELDYRISDADGQVRWIHATGTLIRGEAGTAPRVAGVMMDVSQRRKAADHSRFLADATAELARSLDYRANVAGLARVAVPSFADMAAAVLVSNGEFPGEVAALHHRDPGQLAGLEHLRSVLYSMPDRPGALAQSIRSGTPLFLSSLGTEQLDRMALSEEHLAAIRALDVSALICVPLSARGTPLGGLVFAQAGGRRFEADDFALASELGRRASLAIENALLLEQSFEREGDVSRANEALQLIADAGVVLNRSLDLGETVQSLAELVVPRFANVCSISLRQHEQLERVALAANTEEVRDLLLALDPSDRPDPQLLETASQVLSSGRPIFLPEVPEEVLERIASTPENKRLLGELSLRSLIFMPLSARDQTLGVMAFLRLAPEPAFDREALSLAGQIARRTAIAVDNARLYADARRANDAKDEFLGMMSHELRTPITVIHGGARVLRVRADRLDEETRNGLLDDIERESERLSRMLENLLALARAELDREVNLEPVLLQRFLPHLMESLESGLGRHVTFRCAVEPPAVSAEPGYIEHIVRNLVGNAVKYSPSDAPIEVVLANHGEGAAICVRDRGFGIADDEAGRIFERFYRSDRTSKLAGGAGLGLAVCKRLVEAMSGEIWATPREGGGLEVGFSLPPYREEHIEP